MKDQIPDLRDAKCCMLCHTSVESAMTCRECVPFPKVLKWKDGKPPVEKPQEEKPQEGNAAPTIDEEPPAKKPCPRLIVKPQQNVMDSLPELPATLDSWKNPPE